MITRLQYRNLLTAQRGAHSVNKDRYEPLYDSLTRLLRYWDILQIVKYDGFAYEDTVIFLIQHLEPLSDSNDVERRVFQALAEQTGSANFDPEDVLLMKALAEDIFECWNTYRQRNETSAFTPNTRARSRMRQHYLPRVNTR